MTIGCEMKSSSDLFVKFSKSALAHNVHIEAVEYDGGREELGVSEAQPASFFTFKREKIKDLKRRRRFSDSPGICGVY